MRMLRNHAATLTAAAALTLSSGLALTTATAGPAAASQSSASRPDTVAIATSTCNPKTDYEDYWGGAWHWSNFCGIGTWALPTPEVLKVRDATYPYHRIWLHGQNAYGQQITWCAWGPNDQTVPSYMYGYAYNLQVSDNTAAC